MIAVASTGYNRPEMQDLSLEYLAKCPEAKNTPVHLYIDHGMSLNEAEALRSKYKSSFKEVHLEYRPTKFGLSRNILLALKHMFETYDLVCLLEDDILVSNDFLKYHQYIQNNFITDDIFTVSGYARHRVNNKLENPVSIIYKLSGYYPDGVVFNRKDFEIIKPYINEDFFKTAGRVDSKYWEQFYDDCLKHEEEFVKFCWPEGKKGPRKYTAQDGLLNTIRSILGKRVIAPEISRCQDIGTYGTHTKQKFSKGENVKDEEFWSRQDNVWYSRCFSVDNKWDKLYIQP